MRVRLVQRLTLNGETFPAGEVAELPSPTALACLRRGTAMRADLPAQDRVSGPPQNRVAPPRETRVELPPEDQAEEPSENRESWWDRVKRRARRR